MKHEKVTVNSVTLNYMKKGEGLPLILLHGNGEDHRIFTPLIDKLSNQYTVYAVDSRNHGASSRTEDFSYESMTKDILGFIKKLELKNPSIIGFSDGAIIAVMLELSHPGSVGKLALLGLNLKPSDFKQENIAYLEEEYAKSHDPLLKLMLDEPNIELNALKNIKVPTLIVRAEDELFKDELYEDIVKAMPDAQLLIMKGHDHGSYIINSDALYQDLRRFL